jgi:hypothetical protein
MQRRNGLGRVFWRRVSGVTSSFSSSLIQSSSSEVDGFFFRPGTSRTVEDIERLVDQPAFQAGEVHLDDVAHGLGVGELDEVEEAAPQEGVGQFLLVVGGDDDDGRASALMVSPVS